MAWTEDNGRIVVVEGLDDGSGGGLTEMGSNSWDIELVWEGKGRDLTGWKWWNYVKERRRRYWNWD